MKNFKVTSSITKGVFKLYVNGLLHVCFKAADFKGFQSYKEREDWWCIEYYLTGDTVIETAYNDSSKWEAILKQIDKLEL